VQGKEACSQERPETCLNQPTKSAGGDPRRPRRLQRCVNQDRSRGRNYTSNRGGHATFNGCVRLDHDTSGTRPFVKAVRDAYSRCGHAYHATACVLPLAGCPELATSIAGGVSISRPCYPRCLEHQVFQDRQLPCPKHVGATATFFVAAQPTGTSPERTTDGCCYYHFKTSFMPDRSVGAGKGSADPARTSTEGAAPINPPGGVIDCMRQSEHSRVSRAALSTGRACNGRTQVRASRAVQRTRTSLGRQRVILGRAAGERSRRPGGRTRCALLTRYAFGDDTIGSLRFIAAVTRTAGLRPFGGAGLCVDQWLGGRDSELTCVCSRTGVSIGPGDSYPAAERLANVSVRGPFSVKRSRQREQRATICFHSCRWISVQDLNKYGRGRELVSPIQRFQPTSVSAYHAVHTSCDSRTN
jgi:hypothetical protein